MKRFTSKLDRILRVRAQQEQLARTEAARANSLHSAAEEALQAVRTEHEELMTESTAQMSGETDGATLQTLTTAGRLAEATIERGVLHVNHFQQLMQQALDAYAHARAEQKIVDELIHRERLVHRRTQHLIEESQLQEQTAQAFHRRQQENEGKQS
ncbi:MAG: hypothetical protein KDA85_07000 [Planctomycetaceae bacterium]|nr:hypothetical protein [Planctomycetaceae bacterium]